MMNSERKHKKQIPDRSFVTLKMTADRSSPVPTIIRIFLNLELGTC